MTGNPWDEELTLTDEDVRRLLSSQFPAMPLEGLRLLAHGWERELEREAVAGVRRSLAS